MVVAQVVNSLQFSLTLSGQQWLSQFLAAVLLSAFYTGARICKGCESCEWQFFFVVVFSDSNSSFSKDFRWLKGTSQKIILELLALGSRNWSPRQSPNLSLLFAVYKPGYKLSKKRKIDHNQSKSPNRSKGKDLLKTSQLKKTIEKGY